MTRSASVCRLDPNRLILCCASQASPLVASGRAVSRELEHQRCRNAHAERCGPRTAASRCHDGRECRGRTDTQAKHSEMRRNIRNSADGVRPWNSGGGRPWGWQASGWGRRGEMTGGLQRTAPVQQAQMIITGSASDPPEPPADQGERPGPSLPEPRPTLRPWKTSVPKPVLRR